MTATMLKPRGRIATAFLAREGGWDEACARRLIERLVADGWLVPTRRGQTTGPGQDRAELARLARYAR